jgi:hypothetical protein
MASEDSGRESDHGHQEDQKIEVQGSEPANPPSNSTARVRTELATGNQEGHAPTAKRPLNEDEVALLLIEHHERQS